MSINYRDNIRKTLREHLTGKNNFGKKEEICSRLGITESTITKWTIPSSSNIPSAEDLPIICSILNISLYELFGCEDNTLPNEAKDLYKAFKEHASAQESVKKLLDIK